MREIEPFGLPPEMHQRRIDEKLLLFNQLSRKDAAASNLAVIAIAARKVNGQWLVHVVDPAATATDQSVTFGSFVEDDGKLSQRAILESAEDWIRCSEATKRVPGRIFPASDPYAPKFALGYLLVEAAEVPAAFLPGRLEPQKPTAVSCETCVAACCRRGMTLLLSDTEHAQQRRAMKLRRIKASVNYPRDIPVREDTVDIGGNAVQSETTLHVDKYLGVYVLKEHCGNLGESPSGGENKPCTIHNQDGIYPEACRTFAVGSAACLARRAQYGLDGHRAVLRLDDSTPVNVRTWNRGNGLLRSIHGTVLP